MSTLDLNRGVTIRIHPAGFRVAMYKDEPGAYLDSSGNEISAEVAKRAGFDIERDNRMAAKNSRIAEMRSKIEAEFADKEKEFEAIINASVAGSRFHVEHVGGGKYSIFDEDGKRFTQRAMGKAEAAGVLEDLLGGKPAKPEKPEAPPEVDLSKMDKRQLEAHAKERFGVDLDLRTFNTKAKIIAEIGRLAAEAAEDSQTEGGDDHEEA